MKVSFLMLLLVFSVQAKTQNTGIGTTSPQARLHIINDFEILRLQGTYPFLTFYSNSGNYNAHLYSYGNNSVEIGTNNLTSPVMISPGQNTTAYYTADGKTGIGLQDPAFRLDIAARMRIRHQGNTAGIWMNNSGNLATGFIGMNSDQHLGLYGSPVGWALLMNTGTGNVRLGGLPNNARLSLENGTAPALEINGAIKVSGAVKPAFRLLVTPAILTDYSDGDATSVLIDHPLSNGDANCMIILTTVQMQYLAEVHAVYDPVVMKWKIRSQQDYRISGLNSAGEVKICINDCTVLNDYVTAVKFFGFIPGDQFNVLIIKQ